MVGCSARIDAFCRGLRAVGIIIHCDGGWSERESGYCEVESWRLSPGQDGRQGMGVLWR